MINLMYYLKGYYSIVLYDVLSRTKLEQIVEKCCVQSRPIKNVSDCRQIYKIMQKLLNAIL